MRNASFCGLYIATILVNINYEVMTDWTLFGTSSDDSKKTGLGVWTLGSVFDGNVFTDVRVMSRHVPSNPLISEYRLQLWDGEEGTEPDAALSVDSELWYDCLKFNTDDGGETITVPLQDFALASGWRVASAHTLFPEDFDATSNWDSVTGTFTLNVMYVNGGSAYAPGDETIVLAGFADLNDYSVTVSDFGRVNVGGKNYAVVNFKFDTEAVSTVAYTVVPLTDGESTLSDQKITEIGATISQPAQDTYEVSYLESPGNVTLDLPDTESYAVVAVAFNSSAEAKGTYVGYIIRSN